MKRRRERVLTALHVIGLWAILVAHPLLDVVGQSPEFFVGHRAEPLDVAIVLVTLLTAPPALLLAAIWFAAAIGPRARQAVIGAVVAALVAAAAAQIATRLGMASWRAAAPLALAAGTATAVAYLRFAYVRTFCTVLSAGAVLVPVVFLMKPGVWPLLQTSGPGAAALERPARALPPLVLIVFDEMPLVSLLDASRSIDAGRLPHLAALARDGVWFRNATAVSDYTRWAVPSTLTGRYPHRREVPTAGSHPDTLFTLLRRTHRLDVAESVTTLCPRQVCDSSRPSAGERLPAIARDLAVVAAYVFLTPDLHSSLRLPDLSAGWAAFADREDLSGEAPDEAPPRRRRGVDRRILVDEFIARIRDEGEQPPFYFLHPQVPHQPWVLLPGGQQNATRARLPSAARAAGRGDEWEILQNQQRHLLQIGYVDHVVGRLIGRLKDTGLYDRALVIVTADHGLAITKGFHPRNFAPGVAGEIMRIPLIVKLPSGFSTPRDATLTRTGQRVVDRNVESIDIAPTVAQVMGAALPWAADGVSMLDSAAAERPEKRIWFASATKVARYPPAGPDIEEVLQRRFHAFGEGNVFAIPRPPRFRELLGRAAADLPTTGRSVDGGMAFEPVYAQYSRAADPLPFDVGGILRGRDGGADPVYVAVSVNGVIHALTRTWTTWPGWLATPPPDVWREGRNEVGVYLVEDAGGQPRLTAVRLSRALPTDLNLISTEAAQFWNVRQTGFHRLERRSGFRWTRATASLAVPLRGLQPSGIRLVVARGVEPSTPLRVAVNGCTVFDGSVSRRGWDRTLPLDGCRITGDPLIIELRTIGVRPPRDTRTLGVAVREIALVAPAEPPR